MPTRTPNQDKALKWFCEVNGLKPQLSSHPLYYFTDEDGNQQKHLMSHIMGDWERDRQEKKRV